MSAEQEISCQLPSVETCRTAACNLRARPGCMLEMELPLEVVRLLPKTESVVRLEENGFDKMNLLQFLPVLADKLRVG